MRVLVTGGAGFIGSHLISRLVERFPDWEIDNLDKLTYAADINNLLKVKSENYRLIEGDIANAELVQKLFEKNKYQLVYHLAAESHVDTSIRSPDVFIKTNISGTFNLLKSAKSLWLSQPGDFNKGFENSRFIQVSTDEVYGSLGKTGCFTEDSPIRPNNPYSASKASGDLLARSFFQTYRLPVIISNCSNNFGPHQNEEKLIPTVIRKALGGEKIPIFGKGKNIRDWLYVKDHCQALISLYNNGSPGETYNLGGERELENIQLVKKICEKLNTLSPGSDDFIEQIDFIADRPGHDFRYAVSIEKIRKEIGWSPSRDFERHLEETIRWFIARFK